jgi:hypothetical protein
MPKRSELSVEQRREAVLALLRQEEPAGLSSRLRAHTKPGSKILLELCAKTKRF